MELTLATSPMRFVLVHYHIFKNAGSTVEWIFRREFPDAFATLHSSDADAVLGAEHLAKCLVENPQIKAVSSHHLRYPMGKVEGAVLFDCCFLRHPLKRLQSMYEHFRRTDSSDWISQLARRESSRGFLRQLVEESPHLVSDVQTLYLSTGGAFTRPAGVWDSEKALDTVCQMAFPGVVELFDESLVVAEYFLRPAFPELRLDYVAQNVSPGGAGTQSFTNDQWVGLWGEDLYRELLTLNKCDLNLFEGSTNEIYRRTLLVPSFSKRLDEFRERCAARRLAERIELKPSNVPARALT